VELWLDECQQDCLDLSDEFVGVAGARAIAAALVRRQGPCSH
jgi:hypothetical protein